MYDIGDSQSDRGSGARDRSAAKGTGTSGGDDPKKSGKKQFVHIMVLLR